MSTVTQIGALTDFTAGTTIVSADVDSNFSSIRTQFNNLVSGNNQIDVDTIRENTSSGGVTISSPLKLSSVTTGITASTTQSQGQQALTSTINIVSTNANENDVVTLPAASTGRLCIIVNGTVNVLQVYPASGDAIDANSANTSVTMNGGTRHLFFAVDATNWWRIT